ncbi:MAG TPA: hypothetical protein VE568_00240 [Rubrobacter sp.]|nr:hypothetical protein [Rubrobacter sp.]
MRTTSPIVAPLAAATGTPRYGPVSELLLSLRAAARPESTTRSPFMARRIVDVSELGGGGFLLNGRPPRRSPRRA